MPLVRITRRAGFPAAENKRLLDAVHAGLVEADVKPGFKLDV